MEIQKKRIVFFTRYTDDVPLSRHRTYSIKQLLLTKGFVCSYHALYSTATSNKIYLTGKQPNLVTLFFALLKRLLQLLFIGSNDVAVIEYPLLPGIASSLQKKLLRRHKHIVTDLFYVSEKQVKENDTLRLFLSTAGTVITPDASLTRRLLTITNSITQIPPSLPVSEYARQKPASINDAQANSFRIGWLGTPATSHYLLTIKDCLLQLYDLYNISLVLIGFDKKEESKLKGLLFSNHLRSYTTDILLLKTCHTAVLPLPDSVSVETAAFPMLQYMACALPVVATSNETIIAMSHHNDNLFARTPFEWYSCLAAMIQNRSYYRETGEKNFRIADEFYSTGKTGKDYLSLLDSIVAD